MKIDNIYNMDCLEGMKQIPDGTIDAVICDLPYGTTANKWDSVIPLDKLWEQYKRICKPNAPIVLFGQQPFTSALVMSNPEWFKYEWIWEKEKGTGWLNAKLEPMRKHEIISVFYQQRPTYNPIMRQGNPYSKGQTGTSSNYGKVRDDIVTSTDGERYPESVLHFTRDTQNGQEDALHPTQKPVDLLRYLVLTYTNEGDTVLDNCMGSGTTAIACIKERRHFIGFELSKEYFDKAVRRIKAEQAQLTLF